MLSINLGAALLCKIPQNLRIEVQDAIDALLDDNVAPDRVFMAEDRVSICLLDRDERKRARLIIGPGWVSLAIEYKHDDRWVADISDASESLSDKGFQHMIIRIMQEHVS